MKKIKALFFDIDGTLVSFETHLIPDSTVLALEQAHRLGIGIYISTGRPKGFINNLSQIEHLVDGWITTTGAHCFVDSQTVAMHAINPSDVDRIITYTEQKKKPIVVVGQKKIAIHRTSESFDELFLKILNLGDFPFATIEEVLEEPILQVTPFLTSEEETELMSTLEECSSGRWTDEFTDITHLHADKGKALVAMADYLGLDIAETMAFGDGGNDTTILQQAGIGVAMGNATDMVKQHADYVTTHIDENGVANALKHFGIIS